MYLYNAVDSHGSLDNGKSCDAMKVNVSVCVFLFWSAIQGLRAL